MLLRAHLLSESLYLLHFNDWSLVWTRKDMTLRINGSDVLKVWCLHWWIFLPLWISLCFSGSERRWETFITDLTFAWGKSLVWTDMMCLLKGHLSWSLMVTMRTLVCLMSLKQIRWGVEVLSHHQMLGDNAHICLCKLLPCLDLMWVSNLIDLHTWRHNTGTDAKLSPVWVLICFLSSEGCQKALPTLNTNMRKILAVNSQ